MARITSEVKVGIFVLLAGLILLYITFSIGSSTFLQGRRGRSLIVYFSSVAGLFIKAPVKVAGVDVGIVEDIVLEESLAKVTIRLKRGTKIRANAVAGIRVVGLLGEKYIEITGGTREAAFVPDKGVLRTQPLVTDPDLVMAQVSEGVKSVSSAVGALRDVLVGPEKGEGALQELLVSAQDLAEELRTIIEENRVGLRRTFANLERTTTSLRETLDREPGALTAVLHETRQVMSMLNEALPKILASFGQVVDSMDAVVAENRQALKKTLRQLSDSTQTLPATLEALHTISTALARGEGSVGKLFADEQFYNELRQTIQRLDATLTSLSRITAHIEHGKGALGALVQDKDVAEDVRGSLRAVRGLVRKAQGLHGSFGLYGQQQLDEGRTKGAFSFSIGPNPSTSFLFEAVSDPRRRQDGESELGDLRYSFQFAKRIGRLGLRAGVIENTFGTGADLYTLGDRLSLSIDAYDFGGDGFRDRDDDPHLTLRTRFKLLGGFFASAGVDDILDSDFRTLFLGTGYEFRWGDWTKTEKSSR